MSDEERWAQQEEWDNEPDEIPHCCKKEHPDGDFNDDCSCECHWTKEDWAELKADHDYEEAKDRRHEKEVSN